MDQLSICKSIIEMIKKLLHSKDFLDAYRMPNRFVRSNGKLTMLHIIAYILFTSKQSMYLNSSSIRQELPKIKFPKVTKQAISKARQGILPELFQKLFYLSTEVFYKSIEKKKLWKDKYNVFAIDGSRITLPNSKSNFEKYGEMFSLYNPKRR